MTHPLRLALLPALLYALAGLTAPALHAQTGGSGVSVHTKTAPAEPAPAEPAAAAPAAESTPVQESPPASAGTVQQDPAPADAASSEPPADGQVQPDAQASGEQPANPLGSNAGWDAQFGLAPPQTSQFTGAQEQIAIIERINAYFNEMTNLEGNFLQTDANDTRRRGKFFLERPGKVLFDYSLPSKQKIISNGKYLAIEDHDLNTADRYPLDSTPFRLLLKERVNLAEDARVIALDVGENIVVLTVEDKQAPGGGQIRLFFDWPQLQLKEWIITDAQGLNTRIELASLEANKQVDPKLFTFSTEVGMPKFRGSSN